MTTRLRMHAALIMGITDPIPMPSPMPEAEGAWVRANAWTDALRAIEAAYPRGFYQWCSCQRGTCWNCLNGRCDICVHRQRGGPDIDDDAGWVTNGHGFVRGRVVHRKGQRPCRWTCRCACPKTGPAPRGTAVRTPARRDPDPPRAGAETGPHGRPEPVDPAQLGLFPGVTA